MTNKPMLSVEQELLKDLADYGDKGKVAEGWMVEKLRAILDKEVVVDPAAIDCEHLLAKVEGLCDLAIGAIEDDERRAFFEKRLRDFKDEAALTLVANNQVAPVAWVTQCHLSGLIEQAEPNEKARNTQCWTDAFPVYREQPAPVAADLVHDRAYRDGLKRGFGLGENGQVEQYHKEFSSYHNGIVGEAKDQLAPLAGEVNGL